MHYYETADELRQKLKPVLLVEGATKGGRPARDKREFISAVIRLLRTGSSWRALPLEFASRRSVYSRFRRWQGVLEKYTPSLIDEA